MSYGLKEFYKKIIRRRAAQANEPVHLTAWDEWIGGWVD